ncbi:MAG TPA: polysaccharide biosynthesis tyrosine autokinase [Longimicrobium sp.]|jgi:capsular exopolysaccharide synthesis family protein
MTPSADPSHVDSGSQSSLREIWSTVSRQRWTVLGTLLLTVALVGLYTLVARRKYDSVASVRIESSDPKTEMLSQLVPIEGLGLPSLGESEVDTEIGVLRSRTIADDVAERSALHVQLVSPRTARGEVLRVVRAPRTAPKGRFTLRRQEDGSYRITQQKGKRVRFRESVRPGEAFSLGEITMILQPSVRDEKPGSVTIRVRPFRKVADDFRDDLLVAREGDGSKLLEISYRSTDPAVSSAVVNDVAQSFIRHKLSTTRSESRSTVDVLRGQIEVYAGQLREAERKLQDFQERNRVVAPDDQARAQVGRVASMQARYDQLQVERASLAAVLQQVTTGPRTAGDESPYRNLATFPSFLGNRAIQDLLATLNQLDGQRAALLVRRTEADPDVRQLTGRINDIEQQLHRLATGYLASLDNQLASAGSALTQFGGELSRVPAAEIRYAALAREQKLLSEVYMLLQTRLREAEVKDAVDKGIVRLVDSGLVAEEPDWPKPWVNLILGTVLGLMLGFTAAFGRDMFDTTIRSTADAEQASRGLVVLGTIPRIPRQENGSRRWIALPGRRVVGVPAPAADEPLVTRSDPYGAASEAYRALRTSITFGSPDAVPRVLVMTSALAGEGKSTNAANLAITLAQQGTRVLLVDGDLRRGRLHELLGARQAPGLAHLLVGTTHLDEAVQKVDAGGSGAPLHFLGSGLYPTNPAELISSARMREVVADLRSRFEMVIMDAPPMNLVTDAALLGLLADSTVMVARNGITERASLEHATTQLRNLRVPVGGVVLNDHFEPAAHGYALTYGGGPERA